MDRSVGKSESADTGMLESAAVVTRVLLMRPHPQVTGGVVNYFNSIAGKGTAAFDVQTFIVGRRPGLLEHKLLYPLQFVLDVCKLIALVLFRSYDVYHLNPSLNRAAYVRDFVFLGICVLLGRGRTLVFFRGWEDSYFAAIKASGLRLACFRWFCRHADRLLVLASSIRDDLLSVGIEESKIAITSTTFDGSLLDGLAKPARRGPFTFIFMSRLLKEKGVSELLEAARILRDEGYEFSLVIAGSGPFEAPAREQITALGLGDIVEMPGYIGSTAKGMALLSADVFVFPTYHGEGCPNCILEAMGAGLPVISTRVGGIPDILTPKHGILLDDVQPQTIAAAMRSLLLDEERRKSMSAENSRVAWERYESRGIARYLESVYAELTA